MTHTYVLLDVSPETFAEIEHLLRKAKYDHAFIGQGRNLRIDMEGIALEAREIGGPVSQVLAMQREHVDTWQDAEESVWREGLQEEVEELFDSLDHLHEGPVEHELRQIGSIAINWLRYRERRQPR